MATQTLVMDPLEIKGEPASKPVIPLILAALIISYFFLRKV